MYVLIVLALLVAGLVAPAQAQVHVDIGIHFPAPPSLVVVPEVRTVRYVPTGPANLFMYNGQYWAFTNGGWYVSTGYNGPWLVVAPQFVPRPVLLVPVRYYHEPPGHWEKWEHHQPPRWHEEWGRDWADKRAWAGASHEREGGRGERRGEHGHER